MLDNSFSIPKQDSKSFEPLPANIYQCMLLDVEQRDGTSFQGEPEKQLSFVWVCLEEGENHGRRLWSNSNLKLVGGTKPSNLYKILTGLTGKNYSKDECATSDQWLDAAFLNGFVGTQKLLAVSVKPKANGTGMKNVIDAILPVKADLPPFVAA